MDDLCSYEPIKNALYQLRLLEFDNDDGMVYKVYYFNENITYLLNIFAEYTNYNFEAFSKIDVK